MVWRAVFVTISPLLARFIAEAAHQQAFIETVAHLDDRTLLAERLPALAPDLVVIGLRPGESDEIGAVVLELIPAAKILVMSADARCAYLHETGRPRTELPRFSRLDLLAALGGAGG
jgi:hypothetical protein